jgi:ADP-ribose pyrophosphatase
MSTTGVETVYDGRLFKVQVHAHNDERGRTIQKEIVLHPGAVLIIPVLDADRIVMIRNRRVAVNEQLWEFPAGKLEQGEAPHKSAERELLEETGYTAESIRKLGEFYTSPGFTNELMHVFVAESMTFVGQKLEAGEDIETAVVSVADALAMVSDGRLRDGKSIAALLMWQLHQSKSKINRGQTFAASGGMR